MTLFLCCPPIGFNLAKNNFWAETMDHFESRVIQHTIKKQGGPQSNMAVNSK
jgi:Cu/Ag efflux protein CusF